MRVYYNEWDEPTAAWIRSLGDGCHLPSGRVDSRSIRDVQPDDLRGYDQCHFFAGIGGWPLALRLAGYENQPCWTGSPPCQPFSVAGQQRGTDDERHLAPVWLDLVRKCRPPILFGEQVANAIRHGWLDDLFDALEGCGYACGAAVLPACGVGAPHIRKRLFFGAVRASYPIGHQQRRQKSCGRASGRMGRINQPLPWNTSWKIALPFFRALDDGLPRCVVGTDAARNAIVPQVAAVFIQDFIGAYLKGPAA